MTNLSQSTSSTPKMARYVGFSPIPADKNAALEAIFRVDLEKTTKIKSVGYQFVEPIYDSLDNEKMKIRFYVPTEKLEKFLSQPVNFAKLPILAMISGHVDFKLEKLADKYNFPRGFPMLWWIGHIIDFFGFRAKFKNDDRAKRVTINAKGFAYSKKLSGYLGQAFGFMMDDQLCWTACSKNSADSVETGVADRMNYVSDAARIYTPYMTESVVQYMIDFNTHICSEVLSLYDQNHGARVLKESPVTTTIGQGARVNIQTNTAINVPSEKGFVSFLPFRAMIDLCKSLDLPVCEAVIVTGRAGSELYELLQDSRDKLTDTLYNKILSQVATKYKDSNIIEVIEGTLTHADVLGDTLEGLVVQAILDTPQNQHINTHMEIVIALNLGLGTVFKFKLPNYVTRTMGFRAMVGNKNLENCEEHIRIHVEHWCLTEEGRKYWAKFLWQCMINFGKYTKGTFNYKYSSSRNTDVGIHIKIADDIQKDGFDKDIDQQIQKILGSSVVLNGPYTFVIPFASDTIIEATTKRIETEKGYTSTTKIQKPKKKSIRGWIQVTKTPCLPSEATGPIFQMPIPANIQGWQEKKIDSIVSADTYAKIHQVVDFNSFNTKLKDVLIEEKLENLTKDSESEPSDDVLMIEEALHEASEVAFQQCGKFIDENNSGVIILCGPQACGKSTIFKRLSEKYDSDKIVQCSADIHMGEVFNPMKIEMVHKLCQKDCFKAIRDRKIAIIDNTSMIAEHRTIYHYIAKEMGVNAMTVIVGGELWLTIDRVTMNFTIDALELRSKKRQKKGGKTIDRIVIESSITKARDDFVNFNKTQPNTNNIEEKSNSWANFYPLVPPKMGITMDAGTFKYRSSALRDECSRLFNSFKKTKNSPKNVEQMRVEYEVTRGLDDYYTTIINPQEVRDIKKQKEHKLPSPKDINIDGEPKILGIGHVKGYDGNYVIFAVVKWDQAQKFRESLGLARKHFHVTLAFENGDVHRDENGRDVDKSQIIYSCA